MEVEALMSSMLRLMRDPDRSATEDLIASLDRLAHLPAVQPPSTRTSVRLLPMDVSLLPCSLTSIVS